MSDFRVVYDNGQIAAEQREERLRELYFSYRQQIRDFESRINYLKSAMLDIEEEIGTRWWMDD